MYEHLKAVVTGLPVGLVALLLVVAVLCVLYYSALPKPYPGIPHHAASARSIRGDLPALIKHVTATQESVDWITNQCIALDSPIVQIFLRPFSKPLVVLSDHDEVNNILTHRNREFDRATMTTEAFRTVLPHATIGMRTDDTFKSQRRMWAGTMSSSFLNEVAAPRVHASAMSLLELWQKKMVLATGHPFQANEDIRLAALDAIWVVTFGTELHGVASQLNFLKDVSVIQLPSDKSSMASIPTEPPKPLLSALTVLLGVFDLAAPFPRIRQFFVSRTSSYKKAWKTKETTIDGLLEKSRLRFSGELCDDTANQIYSAMDQVLGREATANAKSGKSLLNKKAMHDELFEFILAGHETTATTLGWVCKYLADAPSAQARLRLSLQNAFPDSSISNPPSAANIMTANLPYLDAVISETLRVARTATATVREAMTDVQILGHYIPKGTSVMLTLSGPSYLHEKDFPIEIDKRHPSMRGGLYMNGKLNGKASNHLHDDSRNNSGTSTPVNGQTTGASKIVPSWPLEGKRQFNPERWLSDDSTFDPNAGPSLPFSAGPRGCFGKKLAMLELRIMITLMVLAFRFDEVPPALNSYAASDKLTRQPRQCYVRLAPAETD